VIVVSGFKVFPNEVEEVAVMPPGVLEAVAIGAPDEHTGQLVKLVVVRKDPQLSEAELIAHCKLNLTAYKVPKIIVFRDGFAEIEHRQDIAPARERAGNQRRRQHRSRTPRRLTPLPRPVRAPAHP
jgi:acyl-CoA synthetase (AMP-forming)/AMP-acid ligase II